MARLLKLSGDDKEEEEDYEAPRQSVSVSIAEMCYGQKLSFSLA
jgi:hypothetical protein